MNFLNRHTSLETIALRYESYTVLKHTQVAARSIIVDIIAYITEHNKLLTKYEYLLLQFCMNIINYTGRDISNEKRMHISYSILGAISNSLKLRKNNNYIHNIARKIGYVLWNKNSNVSRIDILLYKKLGRDSVHISAYNISEFCSALSSIDDKLYMNAHNYIMFL